MLALAIPMAFGATLAGCIGVSQKKVTPGVVGGRAADLKVCRAGTHLANDDGSIDDFEDGNNQLTLEGGRDGYWWTKKDDKGSTVGPDPFGPGEPGSDGSEMALRANGITSGSPDAWGAGVGVNLVNQGTFYDASKYAGISFKAKVGPGGTTTVRFKIGDINTHPDGHLCKGCWNHFGKDLTLTNEWKVYTILFTDVRQEPYWGDPRPAAVTPSKLVAIDWSIGPHQTYDLWIDDIRFISCN